MPIGKWTHVAAVKEGKKLRLYVDGECVGETNVPARTISTSTDIGVGRNPLYGGDESLPGRYAGFEFFAKALTPEEVSQRSKP